MTMIDATGNLHDTATGQFAGHIHTEADASRVLPTPASGSLHHELILGGRAARDCYSADQRIDLDNGVPIDIYELFERVTDRPYDNNNEQDELDILVIAGAFEGWLDSEDETGANAEKPTVPAWHETLRASGLDPYEFELKPAVAADLQVGDVLLLEDRPVTITKAKRTAGQITAAYFDAGNLLPLSLPTEEPVQVIKPKPQPALDRDEILRLRHQHQKWSPDDHTDFLARDMAAAGIPFCRKCADWHKPFEVCSSTDSEEHA